MNPAAIDAFTPGSSIFPRDPLWKTSDVKQHTEILNNLLAEYKGDNEYYQVDIELLIQILEHLPSGYCPNYSWEDKRVKEALRAMKAEGIQKGILNVRRGQKNEGLDLSNKTDRPWQGSGFAQSEWISTPRKKYPGFPSLVVMYEKGEKKRNWDNQPLYLPTLILPKQKFVLMFNYSDNSQESETDDLDWQEDSEMEINS